MLRFWVGVTVAFGAGAVSLGTDERLTRPIRVPGEASLLSAAVSRVQRATGRNLLVSRQVQDRECFVAVPGGAAAPALDALADVFSSPEERLRWLAWGYSDNPTFALLPTAPSRAAEASLVRKQVERALEEAPPWRGEGGPGAAVPARFAMVRSLAPATRARALNEAVRNGRAVLPLSAFPPSTVRAAVGKVNVVRRLPSGAEAPRFSWQEAAAGRGYAQFRCHRDGTGLLRMRMTIGTGAVPPSGRAVPGPTVDLNFGSDADRVSRSEPPLPPAAARRAPRERVTIKANAALQEKETPLANVLRRLAESSGRAVVCRWPTGDPRVKLRLAADIVDQPIETALKALRERYGLEGEQREVCLTLKPLGRTPGSPGL